MRDLYSHRFGRLTALYPIKKRAKDRHVIWVCKCDCGNLTEVKSNELLAGNTKSCYCLLKEKNRQRFITHGDAKKGNEVRLYRTWTNIKQRYLNPNDKDYKRYGGRGITVCDEWLNSYQRFKFWALLSGYADNLTIDRIDNDGDYKPSNCQWITKSENSKKAWKERKR